jgi:hypothetical protein
LPLLRADAAKFEEKALVGTKRRFPSLTLVYALLAAVILITQRRDEGHL